MQDEEFDHMDDLIRAASNSYHPAYDDKAWDKMEVLLDKHLPQKDGRRRPVALVLLIALLVGGAFFVLLYPWDKQSGKSISDNRTTQANKLSIPNKDGANNTTKSLQQNTGSLVLPVTGTDEQVSLAKHASKFSSKTIGHFSIQNADIITGNNIAPSQKQETGQPVETNNTETRLSLAEEINEPLLTRLIALPQQIGNSKKIAGSPIKGTANTAIAASIQPAPTKKPATNKGFANNFAVTISAGPDVSFIGFKDPGKTHLTYGAGLSYTLFKRLTVKAGFYKATKIYSAEPGEYHPPAGYWTYNTDLQRVDANCKVYEIPLSLAYSFGQTAKHSWFTSVGMSSYLMKSETYNYLYKNQAGQTMYKGWTLLNKNKHYFSVLTVSGGYQYQLNKRVSFAAEPYLKLPLHGVGFGKIKLNSGGLLFTASIKPFVGKSRP